MKPTLAGLRIVLTSVLATAVMSAFVAPPAAMAESLVSATAGSSVVAGGVRVTTANLNLRKRGGVSHRVITVLRRGTRVTLTGATSGGFAEVVAGSRRGWASLRYLAVTFGTPQIVGSRVTTADLLVRTSPESTYRVVGEIPSGAIVSITGVTWNGRAQIVHRGLARWVTARYLSVRVAYPVEKGLKPNAIKVHRAARAAFPAITTYYGVRSGSSGDHPTGRALDVMIPSYKSASGKALGTNIARWARANAKPLGIHYVIWNQRIWNIKRDTDGWRPMKDRGGDSANHKNHVHISVF